ncbi:PsbP domain-containing protein [Drosera capensis]
MLENHYLLPMYLFIYLKGGIKKTRKVGPPNSQFFKSPDKSTWNAREVADSVLSDKSALAVSPRGGLRPCGDFVVVSDTSPAVLQLLGS